MEERAIVQSTTCPNCGYENKKEAKFCSHCGGKLEVVNYCSNCGNKVEGGEKYCPNCGENLSGKKPIEPYTLPIAPTLQPKSKRPTGITVICILWFLGGFYNFFIGLIGFGDGLSVMMELSRGNYISNQATTAWASWAVPIEAALMLIVVVLGIMQFVTIYGLWNRRSWSYKYGLAIPIVAIITNWSEMFLLLTAPISLGIIANPIMPIISLISGIIYIAYLRQAHVKEWLRVTVEEYPKATSSPKVLPSC